MRNLTVTKSLVRRLGQPYHGGVNLLDLPLRTRAQIKDIKVDRRFNLRLQELGVRLGAELAAVNRSAFGGRVINIAGTRIAVDHKSARQIEVEEVTR